MKKILLATALSFPFLATASFANMHDDHKAWIDTMFKDADSNSDGSLSKEEFTAHSEKKFEKMDANSDDKLTKEEVTDFKAKEKDKAKNDKK